MNGIVLIDKPAGISSFGVVSRVRYALTQVAGKKVKVGHTGTLDPFATGLLILVIGEACKRAEEFSKLDKTYEAVIHLGETSTTDDPEGDITQVSEREPPKSEVESVLQRFTGSITQIPPIYSAIKVDGQRAYKLARAGKVAEIPPRTIQIFDISLKRYQYPNASIIATVSSGTYIRTLAKDIGEALHTGAYCSELRRTRVGKWSVDSSKTLETFSHTDIIQL